MNKIRGKIQSLQGKITQKKHEKNKNPPKDVKNQENVWIEMIDMSKEGRTHRAQLKNIENDRNEDYIYEKGTSTSTYFNINIYIEAQYIPVGYAPSLFFPMPMPFQNEKNA
jgi:hypothetical protein